MSNRVLVSQFQSVTQRLVRVPVKYLTIIPKEVHFECKILLLELPQPNFSSHSPQPSRSAPPLPPPHWLVEGNGGCEEQSQKAGWAPKKKLGPGLLVFNL